MRYINARIKSRNRREEILLQQAVRTVSMFAAHSPAASKEAAKIELFKSEESIDRGLERVDQIVQEREPDDSRKKLVLPPGVRLDEESPEKGFEESPDGLKIRTRAEGELPDASTRKVVTEEEVLRRNAGKSGAIASLFGGRRM